MKYYFADIDIRNAILEFRQQEESHIMENIIFKELRIRDFHVDVGNLIIRPTDRPGKTVRKSLEIDFVRLARLERNQKGRWAGGCGVKRSN